jgi:hypothetical protein
MLRLRVFFLTMLGLALVACSKSSPGPTPTPTAIHLEPSLTPTPTAALLLDAAEPSPTPPEPTGGEVEIRTPFAVFTGEAPAGVPECVNTIPFSIARDGARTMIEGEGSVNCHFEQKPEGAPHTIHVILEYDAVLNGELLPATSDRPSGWLDAYLTLDGAIVQYYADYPPEATNPCPEGSPCRTPNSDVVPLPFAYEEGSTITVPWTFILHLW